MPEIARPSMNTGEFGDTAQRIDPTKVKVGLKMELSVTEALLTDLQK